MKSSRTGWFLIGLISVFSSAEIFFQIAEVDLPYHQISPELGKTLQPSSRVIMLKDGFYLGEVNQHGYLGPPYTPHRAANTYRVALVGDSYTEGLHLFEKYHFRTVLERELADRTAMDVEVLNFGMGGFNFHDMYIYFRLFAERFEPDLTIFVLSPDDFGERTSVVPGPRPELIDGELEISHAFVNEAPFRSYQMFQLLIDNSAFVKLTSNAWKQYVRGEAPRIVFDKFFKAFRRHDRNDANTCEPVILGEIDRAIFSELAGEATMLAVIDCFSSYEAAVGSSPFPVVDLSSPLNELGQSGTDPRYWSATDQRGHWNHAGQQVVGKTLADAVIAKIPTAK